MTSHSAGGNVTGAGQMDRAEARRWAATRAIAIVDASTPSRPRVRRSRCRFRSSVDPLCMAGHRERQGVVDEDLGAVEIDPEVHPLETLVLQGAGDAGGTPE